MLKTNGHTTLKKGMSIIYRGSWGHDAPKKTEVEFIELCEYEGCKYGDEVDEVAIEDIRRSTFDLADGHWAYGWQIIEIIG